MQQASSNSERVEALQVIPCMHGMTAANQYSLGGILEKSRGILMYLKKCMREKYCSE